MTVDPERLRRALHLDAERDGEVWWVGEYIVRPEATPGERCTCGDHRYRQADCKHLLRVRLAVLGPELLSGLRVLVPAPARSPRS